MSRPARMLLVLGLLSVGAVVALGMMAQRYSARLARGAAPASAATADPTREVERQVSAFVSVREELRRQRDLDRGLAAEEARERLRKALDRALAAHGLSREDFRSLETMWQDWERHERPPAALYRGALARRRDYLRSLSLGSLDPREL